jgi:phosphatidylinositol glycan class U
VRRKADGSSNDSFLFHPFSILTSLSKSSIVFSNLFIAASLSSAVDGECVILKSAIESLSVIDLTGSLLLTAFSLSIATHLSLYPVLLIPPIIVMLRERRKEQGEMTILTVIGFISAFAAHQSILMSLGHWMTGSWEFLSSVYGVMYAFPFQSVRQSFLRLIKRCK